MKTGILLVNLGTPDEPNPSAVYRYLLEFLLDPRVIDYPWLARQLLVRGIIVPFRHRNSAKMYKMLWTEQGSPLKVYGESVEKKLQDLMGPDYMVTLAMRYQNPSIESGLEKLRAAKVDKIIVFPMFPQYASATTGSINEEVMSIIKSWQSFPELLFVSSYFDHIGMVRLFAENARKFDLENYDHILFSYHGLPQRQLRKADDGHHCTKVENCCAVMGDHNKFCYSAQCYATTYGIAKQLNIPTEKYTVCFQSRLGKELWAKPYTSDVLKDRAEAGDKKILVFCPAFVADCLETTIEISHEYAEEFEEMGGEKLDLVESLNDHDEWVATIRDIILEKSKSQLLDPIS
jgi:protoporphyrin/coproporphyrin ferrochelatase